MALIFNPFGISFWDPLIQPLGDFGTPVDWKETVERHVFRADVPGMRKEEVMVEVHEGGRVLGISGERRRGREEEKQEEGDCLCRHHHDTWHRAERSIGKFFRRFRLPENAKMDQARATLEDGVLTVTMPKGEGVKKPAETKAVEISG